MLIKTVGRPANISIPVIRKAADFYGKYLIGNTKLFNNIDLTIIFEKFSKDDNDYAYCDWIDDNHCPRMFEITIDNKLTKRETFLALAHEMTHLSQYAKGELKDIFRPVRMVKWLNEKYNSDCVDYWSCPWEREARAMEMELYMKFLEKEKF